MMDNKIGSFSLAKVADPEKYKIAFWNSKNIKIGILDLNASPISFVGDVDESAKLFFTRIEHVIDAKLCDMQNKLNYAEATIKAIGDYVVEQQRLIGEMK